MDSGERAADSNSVAATPRSPSKSTDVIAEPASLWRRLFASATDVLFISVVVLGLLTLASLIIGPKGLTPLEQLAKLAIPGIALTLVVGFVYTLLFGFLWEGRTPGRRMMGIFLVDSNGRAPSVIRAVLRAVLSVFSAALFLGGFWLALFDRHGQTLHDKLTRTFVVKLKDA